MYIIPVFKGWSLQTSFLFYKHDNRIDQLLNMDPLDNFSYRPEKQRLPELSHHLLEIDI
jgi:hypothetical protein